MARPLTPEQSELVAAYAPLAFRKGDRSARLYPDAADLMTDAAVDALFEAARKYDPARGVKFPTFLIKRLKWRVQDAVNRREARRGHFLGVVQSYTSDRVDRPPPPEPDAGEQAGRLLASLPDRDAAVVRRVVIDGLLQQEAAPEFGVSKSRVSFVVRRSLARLRDHPAVKALL